MLDFTHQLALRGLTITILVTPKNLPILNPLLSIHPSIQTLVFPFPPHPSIPSGSGVENTKDIGNHGNIPIISALSKLHDQIIQWFKSHPSPPVALISDFFLGWTENLAHQIGIPRIVFYSSGAFAMAVVQHLWLHFECITSSMSVVNVSDLPRSPSFVWDHLPSIFRRCRDSSDQDSSVVRRGMAANSKSWGAVFNTFDALEGEYLEWWRKKMGQGRAFAIGPLNLIGVPEKVGRGDVNLQSADGRSCMEWLDGCPDGSVLYACFGSQKLLKKAQMEALAIGLEHSGVRFIWVAKPLTAQQVEEGYGSVPDGFEDRVSGRGLVLKGWAPQVAILDHQAVGGCLRHCGMNSMLEAIEAGVMILGWPMEADQFVNERLLVDYIGAGVRVCEGPETVPDPTVLAKTISESMRGDTIGMEIAKQLRKKALEAVDIGGSSTKDIDGLLRELAQLK